MADASIDGTGLGTQFSISGLPAGERAVIAEFPSRGWRILRWNDDWHGNWNGSYPTFEAAIEALQLEVNRALV